MSELKTCWCCGHECESGERSRFDVRCADCIREGENMEDESRIRWMNGTDRERELT